MYELIAPGVFIIIIGFLFPATVAFAEKRKTWPYADQYEFGTFELSLPSKKYISKCGNAAIAQGFTYLGKRFDNKGKRYKLHYEFFLSVDRKTVVIIGAGSLAGIPVSGMWFASKNAIGNCFVTVTNQNAVEYDLTGCNRDSLILTDELPKAFRHHAKCLTKKMPDVDPYLEGSEMETIKHLKQLQLERLCRDGWAKYIGQNTDSWKYTLKGAAKLAFCQVTQGIIRLPVGMINGITASGSSHSHQPPRDRTAPPLNDSGPAI